MALIKCPQCGQTVLSVASKCPKCSYLLLQAPTPQGNDREFTHCRRCEKVIPRAVALCEYCGYPQLARRRIRVALGIVLLAAVVAAAVIGLRRYTSQPDSEPVAVTQPPIAEVAATDSLVAPEVPVAPPIQTQAEPVPEAEPPEPRTATMPEDAQVRWTVNWANVREGPGTSFPIVGVLRPGAEVSVSGLRRGWWMVYLDAAPQGYVARDLLTARRPTP